MPYCLESSSDIGQGRHQSQAVTDAARLSVPSGSTTTSTLHDGRKEKFTRFEPFQNSSQLQKLALSRYSCPMRESKRKRDQPAQDILADFEARQRAGRMSPETQQIGRNLATMARRTIEDGGDQKAVVCGWQAFVKAEEKCKRALYISHHRARRSKRWRCHQSRSLHGSSRAAPSSHAGRFEEDSDALSGLPGRPLLKGRRSFMA